MTERTLTPPTIEEDQAYHSGYARLARTANIVGGVAIIPMYIASIYLVGQREYANAGLAIFGAGFAALATRVNSDEAHDAQVQFERISQPHYEQGEV